MQQVVEQLGASITLSPRWWNLIASTRIFVQSFCSCSFSDEGLSDRVAMTAHELLENAVKYSDTPDRPVTCALLLGDGTVGIRVSNHADPTHADVLRAQFAEVMDGDPLEVYLAKMQASLGSDSSQLGLARIRYEGEARLALLFDQDVVTVEAIFDISPEGSNG
ncbi:MAG: hypothetical protein H7338_06265 [Candidatus Sericytochromatia bacterium]|nr:hypothetical protein [Candidatus Sericytochromatia bacterium]